MCRSMIRVCLCLLIFGLALPTLAGEGRTPIFRAPTTINASGKYIVTRNLVNAAGGAALIQINALDVDIDLNGFVLDNTANPGNPVITIILPAPPPVQSLTIRDGTLVGGFRGVELVNAEKVVIEDLKINDTLDAGIYLQAVEDFAVRRNLILDAGGDGIRVNPAPPLLSVGTIEANVIKRCQSTGIVVYDGSSVGILNNRIEEITGGGPIVGTAIYLDNFNGGLVAENTIEFEDPALVASYTGIQMIGSVGNKLFDNVIHNAGFDGISLDANSNDNLVVRNVVNHCVFDGIKIGGDWNYVYNNHITSNFLSGGSWGLVFLATADGNTYGKNTARNNTGDFADFGGIGFPNTSFGDNLMPFLI